MSNSAYNIESVNLLMYMSYHVAPSPSTQGSPGRTDSQHECLRGEGPRRVHRQILLNICLSYPVPKSTSQVESGQQVPGWERSVLRAQSAMAAGVGQEMVV